MIKSSIHQRPLNQTVLFPRNTHEPLPSFRSHNRRVKSGLCAVIDDLASLGGESEGDDRDAEDRFDIQDLLLDETD